MARLVIEAKLEDNRHRWMAVNLGEGSPSTLNLVYGQWVKFPQWPGMIRRANELVESWKEQGLKVSMQSYAEPEVEEGPSTLHQSIKRTNPHGLPDNVEITPPEAVDVTNDPTVKRMVAAQQAVAAVTKLRADKAIERVEKTLKKNAISK